MCSCGGADVTSGMLSVRSHLRQAQSVCVFVFVFPLHRTGFEWQNGPGSVCPGRTLVLTVMQRGRLVRGSGYIDVAGRCVGEAG